MRDREELAHRYGLASYTGLLAISRPLPGQNKNKPQSYIAHRSDGGWFVWDDVPAEEGQTTKDHDPRP
jgi:hypothetical protein